MAVEETGVLRAAGHAEDIDQVGIVLGNIHQGKCPFVLLAADQFRGRGTQRAKLNAIEPERGYSRAWPYVFVVNGDGVVGGSLRVPHGAWRTPAAVLDGRITEVGQQVEPLGEEADGHPIGVAVAAARVVV